jgi:hypothetical protein
LKPFPITYDIFERSIVVLNIVGIDGWINIHYCPPLVAHARVQIIEECY